MRRPGESSALAEASVSAHPDRQRQRARYERATIRQLAGCAAGGLLLGRPSATLSALLTNAGVELGALLPLG